ncbi:hypothetical protein, partial [Glaciihabitans sp. dw_435]|uniref:hypothetical protein n=1 Tax=Glaciihabitans sp. dw_435 TaxID=2720081 RepID=UPI001BD45500
TPPMPMPSTTPLDPPAASPQLPPPSLEVLQRRLEITPAGPTLSAITLLHLGANLRPQTAPQRFVASDQKKRPARLHRGGHVRVVDSTVPKNSPHIPNSARNLGAPAGAKQAFDVVGEKFQTVGAVVVQQVGAGRHINHEGRLSHIRNDRANHRQMVLRVCRNYPACLPLTKSEPMFI